MQPLTFLFYFLWLLLLTPSILADDGFSVWRLSAKKVNGRAYYEFGVTHKKDGSTVYCYGDFGSDLWGERRCNCGDDSKNMRVQQTDGQDPKTGFNILINWR